MKREGCGVCIRGHVVRKEVEYVACVIAPVDYGRMRQMRRHIQRTERTVLRQRASVN